MTISDRLKAYRNNRWNDNYIDPEADVFIEQQDPQTREMLDCYYRKGLTYSQTGRRLKVSADCVRKRLKKLSEKADEL